MFTIFFLNVLATCTNQTISGSETTNGLTVAVFNGEITGRTNPGNEVMCFTSTFNPDSNTGYCDTVTADSNGNFNFRNLKISEYNVFSYSRNKDSSAIIQKLNVGITKKDTSVLFSQSAIVSGKTMSNGVALSGARVYLMGTPFITTSDMNGLFTIKNVPTGRFLVQSVSIKRWNDKGTLSVSQHIDVSEHSNSIDFTVILNLE
jgi:hypothetical protein